MINNLHLVTASHISAKLVNGLNTVAICLGLLVWGILCSLQPAFYPKEAEIVGATPSQYGFVFGICSVGAFLASPLFAHYGGQIGPKLLYNIGGISQGICAICFGFLDDVENRWTFLGLSYTLRLLEGVSGAAVTTAVVVILLDMYPNKLSTIAGVIEMLFGLGFMLGPAIGSLLYSLGGFGLPFFVIGLLGVFLAAVQVFSIPNVDNASCVETTPLLSEDKPLTVWSVCKSPMLLLPFFDNFISFCGVGMIESMLQPYMMSEARASQDQVSIAFFIMGGFYMLMTPLAGVLADKVAHPLIVATAGNLLSTISFLFIGPAIFLPLDPSVHMIYGMLALRGLASAMAAVSSIGRVHKLVVQSGVKDDAGTFLVLSGLWTSSFQLGCLVGPISAGFMVEHWGFKSTTDFFFTLYLLMLTVHLVLTMSNCMKARINKT